MLLFHRNKYVNFCYFENSENLSIMLHNLKGGGELPYGKNGSAVLVPLPLPSFLYGSSTPPLPPRVDKYLYWIYTKRKCSNFSCTNSLNF